MAVFNGLLNKSRGSWPCCLLNCSYQKLPIKGETKNLDIAFNNIVPHRYIKKKKNYSLKSRFFFLSFLFLLEETSSSFGFFFLKKTPLTLMHRQPDSDNRYVFIAKWCLYRWQKPLASSKLLPARWQRRCGGGRLPTRHTSLQRMAGKRCRGVPRKIYTWCLTYLSLHLY